ncbi:MAG: hypothetical protein HY016_07500 [Nitrosomonadales bacterium]|nr:hypothetical protein [Nitrosomonadales bacterium]
MQCPFCSTELSTNAHTCKQCGATKVTQRTPVGIFVAWAGMLMAILLAMLLAALMILPFTEHGLSGYPWPTLIICSIAAFGLFKYSKSTIHTKWIRRED